MPKNYYLVAALFLLVACTGTTPAPTASPGSTGTPTSAPTATISITPTLTPTAALPPTGPYLVFQEDDNTLVLIGEDGRGRSEINLPNGGYIRNLHRAISPDGKWIVFHFGLPGWYQRANDTDLSISLLSIPDGSITTVAPLYPEDNNSSFAGLYLLAYDWSPDGRTLAFVSAKDGGSADIYLYEMESASIRRVTDDPANASSVRWSPTGEWLWFSESTPSDDPPSFLDVTFHATRLNDLPVNSSRILEDGAWTQQIGWISPNEFFLITVGDGTGPMDMRIVNVETYQVQMLWERSSEDFALDPEKHLMLVGAASQDNQGTYLVDWDGQSQRITENIFWVVVFRGGMESRFIGFDSLHVFSIDEEGVITQISDRPFERALVSPDHRWFVLYQSYQQTIGMDLFSETDQFVRTITTGRAFPIAWRPDSAGLFYIDEGLYYVAIPDGEPILIDDCAPEGCDYWYNEDSFAWLP